MHIATEEPFRVFVIPDTRKSGILVAVAGVTPLRYRPVGVSHDGRQVVHRPKPKPVLALLVVMIYLVAVPEASFVGAAERLHEIQGGGEKNHAHKQHDNQDEQDGETAADG